MQELFSIGCSTHTIEDFIKILKDNKISAIADVRSTPYSKITPQFNADNIELYLKKEKIYYLDFSLEFGARRSERDVYKNNKVDFSKVIKLDIFEQGIQRIEQGIAKGYKIALMCTEKDPVDCHRFSLVSRGIKAYNPNIIIKHILYNGNIETQDKLEKRLIEKFDVQPELFNNNYIEIAYKIVNERIGFSLGEQDND